ncbi:MAG: SCO family protein [Isosphaeraceae bacterium]|nr:SCO family protein [Isosphaeraceae bacterium]
MSSFRQRDPQSRRRAPVARAHDREGDKNSLPRRGSILLLLVACLGAAPAEPTAPGPLGAAPKTPPGILVNVGFDQNLGDPVPLDLPFRDETGRTVKLGDYFGAKPVILTLNYYECPMLCTLELNALARSLKPLKFDAGKEFEVVTVSIDPREKPALAAAKKRGYLARYGRKGADKGWHFLTGDQSSIERLAKAVGFRYAFDEKSGQYAHAAGVTVVTPQGKIARYFYGLDYPAKDLRLGLVEASEGKIGTPIDQLLLYCFHYDPLTGKYNFVVMSVLRVLGVITVAGLGTFMFVTVRRERKADN